MKAIIYKALCVVGLTKIMYKNDWYRLSGYYYTYQSANGHKRFIRVPKIFSNSVSITGVCGFIIGYDQIQELKFGIVGKGFFFREEMRTKFRRKYEWKKFWFFVRLPKGTTEEQIMDLAFEQIMKDFSKKQN